MTFARIRAAFGWSASAVDWIWRDPMQAVASEVRSPRLRSLCEALLVGRLLLGDLDPVNAFITVRWWISGARLQTSPHGQDVWRAVTRSGAELKTWPKRLAIRADGAAVLALVHQERGFLWGGLASPDEDVVLAASPGPTILRVLPLGGPVAIHAAPVLGLGVWAAQLRGGATLLDALRKSFPPRPRPMGSPPDRRYRRWLARTKTQSPAPSPGAPSVSVLMPVHDPEPSHLSAAIASVMAQTHAAWELCLVDDGSIRPQVKAILRSAAENPSVKLAVHPHALGVSAATNTALALATGEIVAFMDHDDLLEADALDLMAQAFSDPAVMAAYSDEDTVDTRGRPRSPSFKTRFDAERLLSQNFVNHLFCAHTALVRELGGLRLGFEGAQDHDLVLRIAAHAPGRIRHVPRVLYHWRRFPGGGSLSQTAPAAGVIARRKAVEEHLAVRNLHAAVEPGPSGFNRVRWPLPSPAPRVRCIIPTRDRPDLLGGCVDSVLSVTDYGPLEVVVVDNGSTREQAHAQFARLAHDPRVRVIHAPGAFDHSALNNRAAMDDGADVLCLLNDDVLAMEPEWLKEMVSLAVREDVGAVGAKLFYPDGRIQHAGVVLGLGDLAIAGHELRGSPPDAVGLQSRLLIPREVDAVTAACLVIERRKYLNFGGLDAKTFPVAFNDVDLCLRLERGGFKTLWTPYARLIHLESASRGIGERDERVATLRGDAERMKARWGGRLVGADYHPALSREDETFSLA